VIVSPAEPITVSEPDPAIWITSPPVESTTMKLPAISVSVGPVEAPRIWLLVS
jgi:hypothetical protein